MIYILSLEYFPEFTTFVAIRANTYTYLNNKVSEDDKNYVYYKFCEEEWESCECLENVSKSLQIAYDNIEEEYEDDDDKLMEVEEEHTAKVFETCKAVMKKFKETEEYKSLPMTYLNVYMREHFTSEEKIQIFGELNGDESKEQYSKWL